MNQEYFDKIANFAKKAQQPLKEMAELNIKTMQNFSTIKPDELTDTKKPEQILEKQIELAVENGHKALDYMQKSFQIYEKAMLSFLEEAKKEKPSAKK